MPSFAKVFKTSEMTFGVVILSIEPSTRAEVTVVQDRRVHLQQLVRKWIDVWVHQRVAHEKRVVVVSPCQFNHLFGKHIHRLLAILTPLDRFRAETTLERTTAGAFNG